MERADAAALIAAGSYEWFCLRCESIKVEKEKNVKVAEKEGTDISEPVSKLTRSMLRILQWNADGLTRKASELEQRLKSSNVDICLIQETKLSQKNITPKIKGYAAYRSDRNIISGGGLLTYVKTDLDFQKIGNRMKTATEVSAIRVRIGKNNWIDISNVYVPPPHSKGQEINFCPEIIPTSDTSIICGDFNAHTKMWDEVQPEDARGETVENWIIDKELNILNEGRSPTRINRATGNGSTPDLTLCGSKWTGKCKWSVEEDIGGSDHLPILITVQTTVRYQPVLGKKPRWRIKDVDWIKFQDAVENAVTKLSPTESIKVRVEQFTKLLIDTAKVHVGKVKVGHKSKPWMNPTIRTAVKKRNRLRKKLKTAEQRREWLEACKEANDAIRDSKTECWRNLLEDAVNADDDSKLWRIIKGLNGSTEDNAPNEVMINKGRLVASNKKKADLFIHHYAAVSRLKFSNEERGENRRLKKVLGASSAEDESCAEFKLSELKTAIDKMKRKGAAGPDEIPPSFIKALGPKALEVLLSIFNKSFAAGALPQIWRTATIIPLLKQGKPASDLASFRPISLTSCLGKVLERMIANRLFQLAESRQWFNHQQAGFRKGRSCVDQIIRIAQAIEDGFQQKKLHRSVLVLLDFSKAYDTVWRERLLLSMHEKSVPLPILRWLSGFLQNRQAKVQYNDCTSTTLTMRQGLPQGSVLSPLLFLFYINNLAELLPTENVNALFADDVGILATARTIEEAQEKAQNAVDIVVRWSKEWRLTLNATKSEATIFTTDRRRESKSTAKIFIDGKRIPFNKSPKFLGVYLDRELTFGKHVEEITKKANGKLRMLSALSHTTWGCTKRDLLKVHEAHVLSTLDYAAAGYQPWLAQSNLDALEVVQNKALRIVSGQVQNSRLSARRKEASVPSYETRSKRLILQSVEKAKRLPDDHPRKIALNNARRSKNDRTSWNEKACQLAQQYTPQIDHEPKQIELHVRDPWNAPTNLTIHQDIPGISTKADITTETVAATLKRIREFDSDWVLYTDGSASAGTKDGGAGVVITRGDPAAPNIIHTIKVKGAPRTSSYEEEVSAMNEAADWIKEHCQATEKVAICTDSLSLCQALSALNEDINHTIIKLTACPAAVDVQWVPAHIGIPGNEAADQAAKDATKLRGIGHPVSYASACANIRQAVQDPPPTDDGDKRIHEIYGALNKKKDEAEITCREDQVHMARLRSRNHTAFRYYQHKLDESVSITCPRCEEDDDTVEHWLHNCPAISGLKMRVFGRIVLETDILTREPGKCLALARLSILRKDGLDAVSGASC